VRWKPIRTAPQDGSKVKIKCVYGIRPYYEVVHYSNIVNGMDMGYGVWITERGTFFDLPEQWALSWKPL
jgi:hypothetical protein